MTTKSTYAGSKEYYDYYNLTMECSCGYTWNPGTSDGAKKIAKEHKRKIVDEILGLDFTLDTENI